MIRSPTRTGDRWTPAGSAPAPSSRIWKPPVEALAQEQATDVKKKSQARFRSDAIRSPGMKSHPILYTQRSAAHDNGRPRDQGTLRPGLPQTEETKVSTSEAQESQYP